MLEMRELVPFTEAKLRCALVVLAPGPAETRGDQELLPQGEGTAESYEQCLPLPERSSAEHRTISSPPLVQGAMHGAS